MWQFGKFGKDDDDVFVKDVAKAGDDAVVWKDWQEGCCSWKNVAVWQVCQEGCWMMQWMGSGSLKSIARMTMMFSRRMVKGLLCKNVKWVVKGNY